MSDPKDEGGAGMMQGAPRPSWWNDMTLKFHHECLLPDDGGHMVKHIMVDLILPDSTSLTLDGHFSLDMPLLRVREAAAKKFQDLWDPIKRCRR